MRHTFASLLLAAGEPITYVSRQLGHRDASITLRVLRALVAGHTLFQPRECAYEAPLSTASKINPISSMSPSPLKI